jgi:hypothetical protein
VSVLTLAAFLCMPIARQQVMVNYPCSLRLFVYDHLVQNQSALLSDVAPLYLSSRAAPASSSSSNSQNCLVSSCQFERFEDAATRIYTSDALLYRALTERCPRAHSDEDADVYVVPLLLGTLVASAWALNNNYRNANRSRELVAAARRHHAVLGDGQRDAFARLSHLRDPHKASRHLCLWTTDADFVLPTVRRLEPILRDPIQRAIFVHLGDDHWRSRPYLVDGRQRVFGYMPRDIVVPHRVSHWLPFGFPPTRSPPRRLLLSANFDLGRHLVRKQFASALAHSALKLNLSARVAVPRVALRGRWRSQGSPAARLRVRSVSEAAEEALSSVFCICPTGDSKGLSARFYFAIVHGCIPVRVDGCELSHNSDPAGVRPFPAPLRSSSRPAAPSHPPPPRAACPLRLSS